MSEKLIKQEGLTTEMINGNGYELMMKRLIKLPEELHIAREKQFAIRRKHEDLKAQKNEREATIFTSVNHEGEHVVNAEGMKIWKLAFTNKEAREAETKKRRASDDEYVGLVKEEVECYEKQHLADQEAAYLSDIMKVSDRLIRLLELQRGDDKNEG